ncbi:hypothetical protein C7960_1284 [Methanohalophilus euhalobius]|jgi:hypothetical protein|uniref:Uncharacterized protein n=1 Tax=Methanohalophilus euhalobius TaxID=51203 RepID=A0A285GEU6_9EURY|nr:MULTISPECIES: hypothetical protein [Methanohalophilus]OBZ34728.1 MAG: hypothetical protein A9957_02175 [Methanohalophilus sp. DAL1]ODV50162.1 MAG: hypothetical protein A8273_468 [Methanohalophilus sp. 2-GBenrich]RXG34483.1 hypothetical protein CI957_921 [Methanohalophilus sp. WG1-DM]TCL12073.1 hypothetical protein C7960_1284 [Methanohalophilus euhalobius]SNY21016.1 hypothetical protein SAMN06295989_11241 [Methanohalophilus euhalobius]
MQKNNKLGFGLLVAMLLVSMAFVPAVSAQSTDEALDDKIVHSHQDKKFVCMVQNFSNPISIKELNGTRETVINNYRKEKGTANNSIIYSVPQVPEGGRIVAYCFRINDDGTTSQYVGIAGDEKSVSKIRERAKTWYNTEVLEFEKAETNIDSELISNNLSPTSSESGAQWSDPCRFYDDYYLSPYGGVTNNYELYCLYNDGSSTVDWFAIVQEFGLEPGYRAFAPSSWKNDVGYAKQEWCDGNLGNPQLYSYRPNGPYTGQTSQSVTITGGSGGVSAGLTWTYTQPDVSTECYSSTNTDIAEWKITCNSDTAKTSTVGMNPGSTCSANQHSSGNYKILDVKGVGIFRESFLSSKILSTTSSPYISYN